MQRPHGPLQSIPYLLQSELAASDARHADAEAQLVEAEQGLSRQQALVRQVRGWQAVTKCSPLPCCFTDFMVCHVQNDTSSLYFTAAGARGE